MPVEPTRDIGSFSSLYVVLDGAVLGLRWNGRWASFLRSSIGQELLLSSTIGNCVEGGKGEGGEEEDGQRFGKI